MYLNLIWTRSNDIYYTNANIYLYVDDGNENREELNENHETTSPDDISSVVKDADERHKVWLKEVFINDSVSTF